MSLENVHDDADQRSSADFDEYREFLAFKKMKQQKEEQERIAAEAAAQAAREQSAAGVNDAEYREFLESRATEQQTDARSSGTNDAVEGMTEAVDSKSERRKRRNIFIATMLIPLFGIIAIIVYLVEGRRKDAGIAIWGTALGLILGVCFYMLFENVPMSCSSSGFNSSAQSDVYRMSEREFALICREYDYKDILRNPSAYKGKAIKVTVGVRNELNNAKGYWNTSTATAIGWYGNSYVIHYTLSPKILADDVITVYGVCEGTTHVVNVLGVSTEVPLINVRAITLLTKSEADEYIKNAYDEYIGDVLSDYLSPSDSP